MNCDEQTSIRSYYCSTSQRSRRIVQHKSWNVFDTHSPVPIDLQNENKLPISRLEVGQEDQTLPRRATLLNNQSPLGLISAPDDPGRGLLPQVPRVNLQPPTTMRSVSDTTQKIPGQASQVSPQSGFIGPTPPQRFEDYHLTIAKSVKLGRGPVHRNLPAPTSLPDDWWRQSRRPKSRRHHRIMSDFSAIAVRPLAHRHT